MMVELGEGAGRRTVALVTAMDNPLGRSVGNALEVQEALDALTGKGDEELLEVCVRVTREMCDLARVSADVEKVLEESRAPHVPRVGQHEAAPFVERAKAVKHDFTLTRENATAIAAICARLDGLPLAIELAASRIKLLSPTTMLTRLESSLNLLTGGARDLPERVPGRARARLGHTGRPGLRAAEYGRAAREDAEAERIRDGAIRQVSRSAGLGNELRRTGPPVRRHVRRRLRPVPHSL